LNIYTILKNIILKTDYSELFGFFQVARFVDHGGYIFVNIPKSAGNSVRTSLHRCEALKAGLVEDEISGIIARKRTETGIDARPDGKLFLKVPRDLRNWSKIESALTEGKIFTFVRNPYSRAFSGYKEKIILTYRLLEEFEKSTVNDKSLPRRLKHRLERIKQLGLDPSKQPTFENFIKGVTSIPARYADIHFAPQTYLTAVHVIPYDFIGHLESYDKDMDKLSNLLYGQSDYWRQAESMDGGLRNVNYKGGGSKNTILSECSEISVQLIKKYYVDDFHNFGYSTDIDKVDCPSVVSSIQKQDIEIPWNRLQYICRSLILGHNVDKFINSFVNRI